MLLLIFWTLEVGKGHLNAKKAYHRRIPNLEIVTVHRRSDSKRAYRPQAFFLKLMPDSNDKINQKYVPVIPKTYDLSTGYTFDPWFSRRNTSSSRNDVIRTVFSLPMSPSLVRNCISPTAMRKKVYRRGKG
jgi:hypothetical protein